MSDPWKLGDLIPGVLADVPEALEEAKIRKLWVETMGERAAANARPSRLVKGVLHIKTRDGVWANELSLMKPQIIKELDERVPGAVKDIRCSPAGWTEHRTAAGEEILVTDEERAKIEAMGEGANPEVRPGFIAAALAHKKAQKRRSAKGPKK
ncbi:MAG: DUF721 domain-containing protein [Candidatus Aquicultorales bacterium]